MFARLLKQNYDLELTNDADVYISADRNKYKAIFEFIVEYCSDNKLLISNTDILLGKQKYWEFISIFAINPNDIINKLLIELCKHHGNRFILKISKVNQEYGIECDLRRICSMTAIKPYKEYTIYDFILPIKIEKLFLFPHILELIYMYHKLYDPMHSCKWVCTLNEIREMELPVNDYLKKLISMSKPDLEITLSPSRGKDKKSTGKKIKCDPTIQFIKNTKRLLLDYIKNNDYIVLSDVAYNIMEDTVETAEIGIIEIISSKSINKDFELLSNYISKFSSYAFVYKNKSIYVPKESRMEKYSFYMHVPCRGSIVKKHVLNIYNNATYELIHYKTFNQYKLADPIVQTRFIYIFIWTAIIAQKTHGLKYTEFLDYIRQQQFMLNYFKKNIDIYEKKINYLGTYLDVDIMRKLDLVNNPNRFKSTFYCKDV